ncbi:hypothetical protein OG871_30090 [Kitasatospora sp. NBC_00374]|uniref:hypothetical protein n=1 Tax=Kitasatospora sp. NBC_00374 TaxID=2975964 RepID=UPI0030E1BA10
MRSITRIGGAASAAAALLLACGCSGPSSAPSGDASEAGVTAAAISKQADNTLVLADEPGRTYALGVVNCNPSQLTGLSAIKAVTTLTPQPGQPWAHLTISNAGTERAFVQYGGSNGVDAWMGDAVPSQLTLVVDGDIYTIRGLAFNLTRTGGSDGVGEAPPRKTTLSARIVCPTHPMASQSPTAAVA